MTSTNMSDWKGDAMSATQAGQNPMSSNEGGINASQQPSAPAPALREQAADVGRKAGAGAKNLASQAQTSAEERLVRGKQEAASTLTSVAATLLQSGTQLRDGEQPIAGEYIERAARQIDRVASYVEKAEFREIVTEVEDFARRQPAVFIGSAFAVGLLAARFLKNSRVDHQRASERKGNNGYTDRAVTTPISVEPGSFVHKESGLGG